MSTYMPVLSCDTGLMRYLEEVKKFPMLSEAEEADLADRWVRTQDREAAQKLITSHLRLVVKIAMQFRGYGLPMYDVISEGNIGLMTAVRKFDPSVGTRLSTYAMWWIKATIQNYILKSWSIVKIGTTAAHKKLFFNLRKIKSKLYHVHQGSVPSNENALIAKELDVSEDDVRDMSNAFDSYDSSLNDPLYSEDIGEQMDVIADNSANQEDSILEQNNVEYQRSKFGEAMMKLSDRERDIIALRKLQEKPDTLEDLSKKYNVSFERIRQIEEAAMKKLIAYCKN